ncbi:Protein krasavietz,Basic leucine zipper and W2 domain-containing protein 1,Basic leucine zipper and W2 domain-containing protein 2,Basic leucine zipper and W2 domain-containing protein 1-A [Lepeophtheirus salmonis]|uniref:Protein krasavietz,Basic leucine zipper and W2 domain-containing protein 1,Basic leucine zipper and W2 domain-containing protein 2,Basic leucine zipper and W2 domain-containing protein 1-A n=1 Tax=Lepeophtheirus salmonis TaxID=72036 RepID=A0A7R8CCA6_LEPSM|nr:Protein krasavietz,Basic leucine zipper and W2 domain-containing protein 1,Basic leucine zipper and W2 domain-containing protein 2,Basic leucine zipper and W2 domain-containing protein 1-A [Lepeophtheirus salmonis]CAF2761780.1 Protein krasavietz,Basic leucine zipper and W2 domain-containing protein 1,Basic leucine zipper and W2 domain-containing protein 2,Basic leucine zipper and W2 domain-containing protein 1-A [Lepeophtheirus salmonis]
MRLVFFLTQRSMSIFKRGLPTDTSRSDIRDIFSKYRDRFDMKLKTRFAFIEFDYHRDADHAVDNLDGLTFRGRRISVEVARGPRTADKYRFKGGIEWQDLKDLMKKAGTVTYALAHKNNMHEGDIPLNVAEGVRKTIGNEVMRGKKKASKEQLLSGGAGEEAQLAREKKKEKKKKKEGGLGKCTCLVNTSWKSGVEVIKAALGKSRRNRRATEVEENLNPGNTKVNDEMRRSRSKLDYRRYGVNLIEVLIAGGLLAPGGIIVTDGDPPHKTETCLFECCTPGDLEGLKAFDQVFIQLMRRYKYLEKMHEEEMNKILVSLKGFSHDERTVLAQITALWLASGQIPATLLPILINEHQVKDGTALEFLLEVLSTLKSEKGGTAVINVIKKSGMESSLMDFFPAHNQQQTKENFAKTFSARDLPEVVSFKKQQEEQQRRLKVQRQLKVAITEEKPSKEIVDILIKNSIPESDSVVMIWSCVRHVPLFEAFSSNSRSELVLLNKIQEFCYDNMNFLKIFNKIILLLYKTDVLSEDVILKWYRESHSQRGWSVFMDQMKKFIEWLEKAEEESDDDEDDD